MPGLLVRRERECKEYKKFAREDDDPSSSAQRKDMAQSIKKPKNCSGSMRRVMICHMATRETGRWRVHIHIQTRRMITPWCGPESTVWIGKTPVDSVCLGLTLSTRFKSDISSVHYQFGCCSFWFFCFVLFQTRKTYLSQFRAPRVLE